MATLSISVRPRAQHYGAFPTDAAVVASKILLGGADTVARVRRAGLEPAMLADPAAAQVAAVAFDLADHGEPVDLLTVVQRLERSGDLPRIGGLGSVLEIYEAADYPAGADAEACSIVDAWRCHRLALRLRELASEAGVDWHRLAEGVRNALVASRGAVPV